MSIEFIITIAVYKIVKHAKIVVVLETLTHPSTKLNPKQN